MEAFVFIVWPVFLGKKKKHDWFPVFQNKWSENKLRTNMSNDNCLKINIINCHLNPSCRLDHVTAALSASVSFCPVKYPHDDFYWMWLSAIEISFAFCCLFKLTVPWNYIMYQRATISFIKQYRGHIACCFSWNAFLVCPQVSADLLLSKFWKMFSVKV